MESTTSPALASRLLAGLLCVLLIVEPIAANAQVVAASGAGRPTVESAQNGVPLVQIVAPNGAGVSHNVYQSYSVDSRGVVLNNSQVVVATQQAGYIAGNPNLAAGSARIILNEVGGTSPSELRGFTEVAGAKADVVIANPNGITCNGCGFINTGRGILTTGTPVFGGSGSLDAFRVTGGTVSIGENGMEGRYADQIDLLARAVSVQGNVRANALNVVAGANQVAYASLAATPVAGTGAAPTTAIDVAALGGMYANKIRLVATEAGVGVNNRGTLVALAGDFRLDAAGHITQGGVVAASDQLDIATAGDIENNGSLFGRDITVRSANLSNRDTGVIAAGNSAGLFVTNTLANLDGALIYSGGTLAIAGSAERGEDGRLTTKAAHLLNSSADILAEGDMEIAASVIDNKRTVFEFETTAVAGSRSTLLAQELDGDWDGELIGRTFANGWTSEVTTIEMVPGPEGPVPTEVTRTVFTPYGAYDWMVADAASVENFTILNLDRNARRYAIVTERLVDHLVAASPESRIIGRNVLIDVDTLNNAASRFEASGDLTATVTGRFSNDGGRLLNRNRRTMWSAACGDIQGDRPGRLGYCQDGGGFRWVADAPVDSDRTETADSPASTITAAGHYTLNAEQVSNGVTGAGAMPPGGFSPGRIGNLGNPGAYLFGLPAGGLYTVNPDGSTRYIVETDPRFTRFGNFIGSDYMLAQLGLDPLATQKRLGDAYYEQQLVRDQLLKLRGKTDYRQGTSLNAEYQALLESGADFAREFQLAPGVALTQEQVAALSRDIVWLESRKVAGQDVLVPVVYLGATYTPRSTSALMGGGKSTTITATDINNRSGTIAGETVTLTAANDIVNESGLISGQDVTLTAGRDIKLATATTAVELHAGQTFTQEGEASRIDARTLAMTAGNDLSLQGAQVTADNATLQAGRNLTIGSQEIATERNLHGVDYRSNRIEQRGSSLDIKNDLALIAGNDFTVAGSDVKAGKDLLAYAGNNLAIVTARETETLATSAHSDHVDDVRQFQRDTGRASTLTAGNNLALVAGNTLYAEGATLKATGDASLQADTLVLAAAHDTYSENSNYSNIGKRGSQQRQTQIQTDTATGSIVSAGGDLNLASSGDTIVEGSALAAGKQANIDVGGDLKLLAAQSSRYVDLYKSSRGAKEATELKYHEEGVRQLLTTITVGTGANIAVGGNFVAAIAEKNEDGSFKADRMTVDGIVKGDSRQQVDVKRTGDDATNKPETSQVLGDLKRAGIRNGSNDDFEQKATQTGTEALQAYLASGLIQVRSDPQLSARLGKILRNAEGATLTYKDDTGKVSLTVAGQAKVQEVFNTLKLTETFDKKHFADQQTAMIVTLIVAIVLTICTAGAGAASIGMVMASGNAVAAAMINAAIIGMASTMTGQLAGGASFDDAFQAGVKAGVISAATAGIAAGASEIVNGASTAGNTGSAAANTANTAETVNTASTVQSAGQTVQVGSNGAQSLSALDKLTTAAYWEQTALNATGQGLLAEAQGGKFADGFKGSVIGGLAATGANIVGDYTSDNALLNIGSHAVLGCAVASANRQDCGSGALGGAASASLARVVDGALGDSVTGKTRDAIIAGTTVAGSAAIASAAGKDMVTAANAAANEVTNNYLDHREAQAKEKAEKRLAECSDDACRQSAKQEIDAYNKRSAERDNELRSACAADSAGANCQYQIALVKAAAATYDGKGVFRYSTVGDEMAHTANMANTPHYQPDGLKLLAARIGMPLAVVGGVRAAVTAGEIASYCLGNPVACNAVGVDVGILLSGNALPNGVNNGAAALEKAVANQVEKAAARVADEAADAAKGAAGKASSAAAKGGGAALADTQAVLTRQVADLRATLTGSAKTGGNMGVAQIDIPGVQPTMAASSRIETPTAAQQSLGFVGEVPETFRSSAVPLPDGTPLLRSVDSEAKILNNVAAQLGENTAASGTINLLTERAPCASCSNIIQQFQAKYPNIKINVLDNGGTNIPPNKKGP